MQKLIVGNWKMYPTLSDSLVLTTSLKSRLREVAGVEVVLAPPTAWLVSVVEAWGSKLRHVSFASQNVWSEDQGAFTGEVSSYMLKNLISYAIVGHSERRRYAHESNELINQKVRSCLKWRIKPILCIGEEEKSVGGTVSEYQWRRLTDQLIEGLADVSREQLDEVVVAYEPIWAVGSSNPATPEYAVEVIRRLKERLIKEYDVRTVEGVRFLYGGSVTTSNAAEFLRYPEISGLLVGGASVKAGDFLKIVQSITVK